MAEEFISFAELLWKLPLFDDLFLSMQGQNVMLVDLYLRDLERDLLREIIEIERTPFPATLVVSALSQMWIFAVYELLRTWRQRVKDLKRDAQKPAVQQSGHSKLALETCGCVLSGSTRPLTEDARVREGTGSRCESHGAAVQAYRGTTHEPRQARSAKATWRSCHSAGIRSHRWDDWFDFLAS